MFETKGTGLLKTLTCILLKKVPGCFILPVKISHTRIINLNIERILEFQLAK
jgi:hypothetical protein